jgi:hypothetical protein
MLHEFSDVANATLDMLTCQQNNKNLMKRQKYPGPKAK